MPDDSFEINISGSVNAQNVALGKNNVVTGHSEVNQTSLDESARRLLLELRTAVLAVLDRVDVADYEAALVQQDAQTLGDQAESPLLRLDALEQAFDRVGDFLRRFPEQAAVSTAGSLSAAAILEQAAKVLG